MNNDQRNHPPDPPPMAVVQHPLVTREMYLQNRAQIEAARAQLDNYAQSLETGYQQYMAQEQELLRRVEEGRQAERILSQLQNGGQAARQGILPAPLASQSTAIPATTSNQPSYASPLQGNARFGQPSVSEQTSHGAVGPSPNSAAYSASRYYRPVYPPATTQPSHTTAQSYYRNQPQVRAWHQTTGPHSYAQSVHGNQATQHQTPQASFSNPSPFAPVSIPQMTNVGNAQQKAPGPNNGSATGDYASSSSTMGSTEDRGQGIPHAKVTYTSQSRKTAPGPPNNMDVYRNVFNVLKGLRPNIVDFIILTVLDALKEKFSPGSVPNEQLHKAQSALPEKTKGHMRDISKFVIHQLQAMNSQTIIEIIRRIKANLPTTSHLSEQSDQTSNVTLVAGIPLNPNVTTPTASQPASSRISAPPPAIQQTNTTHNTHPAPASSVPVSVPTRGPLTIQHIDIPLAGMPAHTSNTGVLSSEPIIPAGISSQNGKPPASTSNGGLPTSTDHVTLELAGTGSNLSHRPDTTNTVQPSGSPHLASFGQPNVPLSHYTSVFQATVPVTPKRSNGNAQSTTPPRRSRSPWTPAKANKARLAHDIMRSLGRPTGATSNTSPSDAPVRVSTPPYQEGLDKGKRKRHDVSPSPSEKKKQRINVSGQPEAIDVEEIATDGALELAVWQRVNVENAQTNVVDNDQTMAVHQESQQEETYPQLNAFEFQASSSSLVDALNSATIGVPNMSHSSPEAVADVSLPESMDKSELPIPSSSYRQEEEESTPEVEVPNKPAQSSPKSDLETSASAPPSSAAMTPEPSSMERPPISAVHIPQEAQAGPSTMRTPLFLPSPTSSQAAEQDDVPDMELMYLDNANGDEDVQMDNFVLNTNLLGPGPSARTSQSKGKGKQRAVVSDDDEVEFVETPEKSEGTRKQNGKSASRRSLAWSEGDSKKEVYVAVPPLPPWAKKLKAAEAKKAGKSVRRQRSVIDISGDELDQIAPANELANEQKLEEQSQKEAVELSYSRLRELPCRWAGCGAVLNCTFRLIAHARLHTSQKTQTGDYLCEWLGCGCKFKSKKDLSQHLVKHASPTMYCAFEGCDRSFPMSNYLLQHHRSWKHKNQPLRRDAKPHPPAEREALPPLPAELPSYMVVPRRVARHPISEARHQWLGAQVLENITSYRSAGRRIYAGGPSRGARHLAETVRLAAEQAQDGTPAGRLDAVRRMTHDQYDGIAEGKPLKESQRCDDMLPGETTRLCDDGLVLFPPPGEDRDEPEELEDRRQYEEGVKSEADELDFLFDSGGVPVYYGPGAAGPSGPGSADAMQVEGEVVASGGGAHDDLNAYGGRDIDFGHAVAHVVNSFAVVRDGSGGETGAGGAASHQPSDRSREAESQLPGWTALRTAESRDEDTVESLL